MKEVNIPNFGTEKNDYLQLTLEGVDGFDSACVVHLDGFIDTYNSSFFQTKVTKVIAFNYKAVLCFFYGNRSIHQPLEGNKTSGWKLCIP